MRRRITVGQFLKADVVRHTMASVAAAPRAEILEDALAELEGSRKQGRVRK
jgi:hypothetical protein